VVGFNVYEAIHQCKDLLLGYGGHFYAAGMTLEEDKVDAFCQKFEEVVHASLHPDLMVPELVIDAEINLKTLRRPFTISFARWSPLAR
jgi:single-stranded-DNA-specific exonuclease